MTFVLLRQRFARLQDPKLGGIVRKSTPMTINTPEDESDLKKDSFGHPIGYRVCLWSNTEPQVFAGTSDWLGFAGKTIGAGVWHRDLVAWWATQDGRVERLDERQYLLPVIGAKDFAWLEAAARERGWEMPKGSR